jgi:hypothetical protein
VAVIALAVAVAGPAPAAERHAAAQSATVTITDSRLIVSRTSMLNGVTTFVAINRGRKPHAFAIKGPKVSTRTAKVAAGRSARLTVLLHGGTYTLWDPVALGRAKGQQLQVKVPPPPKVSRIEMPSGELGPTYSCDDDVDDIIC